MKLLPLGACIALLGSCAGYKAGVTEMTGESSLLLVSDSPNSLGRYRYEGLTETYPEIRAAAGSMGRPDMIYQDDLADGTEFVVFFYNARRQMIGFTGGSVVRYSRTVGPASFDPRAGEFERQAFRLFGATPP